MELVFNWNYNLWQTVTQVLKVELEPRQAYKLFLTALQQQLKKIKLIFLQKQTKGELLLRKTDVTSQPEFTQSRVMNLKPFGGKYCAVMKLQVSYDPVQV